jgi:putative ATPase
MGNEEELLRSTVVNSLTAAERLGLESIAIPAISTGVFGYPKHLAIPVILQSILGYIDEHPDSTLQDVRICDRSTAAILLFVDDAKTILEN